MKKGCGIKSKAGFKCLPFTFGQMCNYHLPMNGKPHKIQT